MSRNDNRKSADSTKWIGIVLVLLFTQPVLFIPLAIFGGIFWIAYQAVKKHQGGTPTSTTRTYAQTTNNGGRATTRATTRRETFDECPQPFFCFHKDKGEHHVRRGKEVDTWDRPDIDISKYQRKN